MSAACSTPSAMPIIQSPVRTVHMSSFTQPNTVPESLNSKPRGLASGSSNYVKNVVHNMDHQDDHVLDVALNETRFIKVKQNPNVQEEEIDLVPRRHAPLPPAPETVGSVFTNYSNRQPISQSNRNITIVKRPVQPPPQRPPK